MKKRLLVPAFLILTALFVNLLSPLSFAAPKETPLLSPGLSVIAAKNDMGKAGFTDSEITFKKEDFSRALNLSSVSSITVTKIPSAAEGKLLLGNTVVSEGQKIVGSNLSLLKFSAASDKTTRATFSFSPNDSAYEMKCVMYMLESVNYAPTVSVASSLSLDVMTYSGTTHFGKLSAHDPDGDELIFEIVSYPKEGLVILEDASLGEYRYIPTVSSGRDSFKYVAKDKYGNYSAAAEVSLTIKSPSITADFADMKGSSAENAAIAMSESRIMSGTQIGNGYYFQPELAVSRAEFVVMAMKALGIDSIAESDKTVFADDDKIPSAMKSYISAAYELGYTKGSLVDGKLCFEPDENISRAEAAVIVGRMIEVATPTVLPIIEDREEIPAWAESSVYALSAAGIIDTDNGEVRAEDDMTRADTARMLAAMMRVK